MDRDIPWLEIEKIRHEINTNYIKYKGLRVIAHPSVGLDNIYYIYYVENFGFDNFNLLGRAQNLH